MEGGTPLEWGNTTRLRMEGGTPLEWGNNPLFWGGGGEEGGGGGEHRLVRGKLKSQCFPHPL